MSEKDKFINKIAKRQIEKVEAMQRGEYPNGSLENDLHYLRENLVTIAEVTGGVQ